MNARRPTTRTGARRGRNQARRNGAQRNRSKVLFVQGGGEGAYDFDAKLAAGIGHALAGRCEVRYPRMPREESPDYERWARAIERELAKANDDVILVGHSIGANILLRLVADGRVT